MYDSGIGANGKVRTAARPVYRSDFIVITEVMKLGDLRASRTPYVNTAGQADDKVILLAPIDQVKVIIILQSRCIEHLERNLGDLPLLSLGHNDVVLVEAAERWLALPEVVIITTENAFFHDWV